MKYLKKNFQRGPSSKKPNCNGTKETKTRGGRREKAKANGRIERLMFGVCLVLTLLAMKEGTNSNGFFEMLNNEKSEGHIMLKRREKVGIYHIERERKEQENKKGIREGERKRYRGREVERLRDG